MFTPSRTWLVEVVQVTSRDKQQEILELLKECAGLTVLGTSSGHDHFVVFGCDGTLMGGAAEALIAEIDLDAVRTYVSNQRPSSETSPRLDDDAAS